MRITIKEDKTNKNLGVIQVGTEKFIPNIGDTLSLPGEELNDEYKILKRVIMYDLTPKKQEVEVILIVKKTHFG